jgi:hypothetical protein
MLLFRFLMCKKTKYILQKSTPKIKQLTIQLVINQFFLKDQKRKHKQTGAKCQSPYLFIFFSLAEERCRILNFVV